jgi:hypothetical protein
MFVRPLALLIFNIFTCFFLFCNVQILTSNLDQRSKMDLEPSEEVDPCQVCSTALTHGRTQGAAVKRRPSQPASHVDALANHGGYLRSTVWCTFDYKITGVFERRPMTCLSIHRSLSSFGRGFCF